MLCSEPIAINQRKAGPASHTYIVRMCRENARCERATLSTMRPPRLSMYTSACMMFILALSRKCVHIYRGLFIEKERRLLLSEYMCTTI